MKNKNKIITAVVIISVLVGAWFVGGKNAGENSADSAPLTPIQIEGKTDSEVKFLEKGSDLIDKPKPSEEGYSKPTKTEPTSPASTEGYSQSAKTEPTSPASTESLTGVNPSEQNRNITADVSADKPGPVESQELSLDEGAFTVTLSVSCDTLLRNMNSLNKEKHELIPADGIILPAESVTVYEGESVFNVLQREMRRNNIHMEFRNTPIYNSAYIIGINNLYEFDAGELSGWRYRVNGWFPNYGCSRYQIKPDDVVEWMYTCDLGKDLSSDMSVIEGQDDD